MPPAGFVLPRITIPISLPSFRSTKERVANPRDEPFDKMTSGLLLLQKTNQRKKFVKHSSKDLSYCSNNFKRSLNMYNITKGFETKLNL